ncbi:SGNH/GDSL hydrolase family protein [Acetobacter cibinongensis]|uniref:SGNH hydrolase-type esterase domain-containing protein n=1 Tax=Acetobacter cibinongensis TaxID=146475 RepID=A0A1Z5YR82_9PROT|nr:SGNH/GDSL hydrolase family protein [Acetobacter cibinongensis]OUI98337.1 hypothetical protein HK14_15665 [Acetobacter cibinongensis]
MTQAVDLAASNGPLNVSIYGSAPGTPGTGITSVAISEDGKNLVVGMSDDTEKTVPLPDYKGASIASASVDSDGTEIVLTMTDKSTVKVPLSSVVSAVAALVAPVAVLSAADSAFLRPSSRLPTRFDDAGRGVSVGDLFVNPRGAWQAVTVDEDNAAWMRLGSRVPSAVSSVPGVTAAAAWGIDAVVSGFTGPSIDITTTVGAKSTVTTISVGADGTASRAAIGAVLAQKDAGTYAFVTQMYDQTGGGNHLVSIKTGYGPIIGETPLCGDVAVAFNQSPNGQYNGLTVSIENAAFNGDYSAFVFGALGSLNDSAGSFDPVMQTFDAAGPTNILMYSSRGGTPQLSLYDYNKGVTTDFKRFADNQPDVIGHTRYGGSGVMYQGGQSIKCDLSPTTLSPSDFVVNFGPCPNAGGGFNSPVIATGFALYGQSLSTDQVTALRANYILSKGGNVAPKPVHIMCIGDSRTAGYRNPANYNWPYLLPDLLCVDASVTINAVSGITAADIIAGGPLDAATAWVKSRPQKCVSIATVFAGINDQGKIGNDPVAISGRMQTILQTLFDAGLDHAILFGESDLTLDPYYKTVADGFSDKVTFITPLADALGTHGKALGLKWDDDVHPTPAGDDYIAAYVAQALNAYLSADVLRPLLPTA